MKLGTLLILDTSSKSSQILNISKIPSQSWFDRICAQLAWLHTSLQFDQHSNLDKEFTQMMYTVWVNIPLTCTNNIPQMKKILDFQKCQQLSNWLNSVWNWTHSEIRNIATNSSGLELGQVVFHCVLQSLCYNLADMHKISPNIHEVIAFTKWLSVEQILRKVLSLKSVLYSHIWNIRTNTSLALTFM
jgi:hypothetical protein